QRVLAELAPFLDAPVLLHGAIASGVEVYRGCGIDLPATEPVSEQERGIDCAGRLVLAPTSAAGSAWMRRFRRAQTGFASGWMRLRGNRRRRNYDRGFVVSDHADWPDLMRTVRETGATRVIATHGSTDAIVRKLCEDGLDAGAFQTGYGEEDCWREAFSSATVLLPPPIAGEGWGGGALRSPRHRSSRRTLPPSRPSPAGGR